MRPVLRRVGPVVAAVVLLAVPLAVHFAAATGRAMGIAGLLVAVQAAFAGWATAGWAISRASHWSSLRAVAARTAAALVPCGLAVAIWLRAGEGLVLAAAVPHAAAFLGLLAVFAASLAPGREPVITQVARRVRGTLSDSLIDYTRGVTLVWCGFFAVQLAASLLMGLLAPRLWWSAFLNLGTLPSVALMFGAELAYRHWRHGIHRPVDQAGGLGQILGQLRAPLRRAEP